MKSIAQNAVGIDLPRGASADSLRECHTVLQVEWLPAYKKPTGRMPRVPVVEFRLFSHSAVAGALEETENLDSSRSAGAADGLSL